MKTNRRTFLGTALAGSLAATLPLSSQGSEIAKTAVDSLNPHYARLDEILSQPVFKKQFFPNPVIIEKLELLRFKDNFLCRVRSKDGAEGISVGHPGQMTTLYPIFTNLLQPFFIGKDARELDLIIEKVYTYKLNFRLSGLALGVPLATIEFAILDMMGRIAQKSIGQLIGDIQHPKVAVYQATEYREKSVAESMELIVRDVEEYKAKRLK